MSGIIRLAETSIEFCRTVDELYSKQWHFLGQAELVARFNRVLKIFITLFVSSESSHHYLNRRLQNDFIHKFSEEETSSVAQEVKKMRYPSAILDYTPEIIHYKQMSFNIRSVSIHEESLIKEHFA
jgi:hypothetical protein